MKRLVVINAGTGNPSSTRQLTDRLAQKALDRLEGEAVVSVIDLGPLAVEIARAAVAGFAGEAHGAAHLERGVDVVGLGGIYVDAHHPARERHLPALGLHRVRHLPPRGALVVAAIDADRRGADEERARVLRRGFRGSLEPGAT